MNILKIAILLITGTCCAGEESSAQTALPPRQPEQDACGAMQLCGAPFFTPYSYSGYGRAIEMVQGGGVENCHQETNSVWFKLKVGGAGNIVFTITPVDSLDDYDFSVYNVTNGSCNNPAPSKVRCNGNCNGHCPGNLGLTSSIGGIIGLDYTSTSESTPAGTFGGAFLKYVAAKAGEEFLILVDNYTGNASGFTIDFKGSTATFLSDGATPAYYSVNQGAGCGNNLGLRLQLTEQILCNSLAADGSNFKIEPALATVISAEGVNCNATSGYTKEVVLTFSNPLPAGTYTLRPNAGSGNTITDLCENPQLPTDAITFEIIEPLTVNAGRDTITCIGNQVRLRPVITGGGNLNTVKWEPALYLDDAASAGPLSTPVADVSYILTVTPNGSTACARKDTINVTVLSSFKLNGRDTAICLGQPVPLSVTGENRFTYTWSPFTNLTENGAGTATVLPDADIRYTLTAAYPGCRDSSLSINITVEPVPEVFAGNDTTVCYGTPVFLNASVQPEGYAGYKYAWSQAASFADAAVLKPAFSATGNLSTQLTVTTAHGCKGTDDLIINVSPKITAEAGPEIITATGKPFVLKGSISDNTLPLTWQPSAGLSDPHVQQPVATLDKDQLFYLTVTGEYGCTVSDSVWVRVFAEIKTPNAFSPNGDGINDVWSIPGLASYSHVKVEVFNRWGQRVFFSNGYADPWKGSVNGNLLPVGVYYYIITINENRYSKLTGSVTILR